MTIATILIQRDHNEQYEQQPQKGSSAKIPEITNRLSSPPASTPLMPQPPNKDKKLKDKEQIRKRKLERQIQRRVYLLQHGATFKAGPACTKKLCAKSVCCGNTLLDAFMKEGRIAQFHIVEAAVPRWLTLPCVEWRSARRSVRFALLWFGTGNISGSISQVLSRQVRKLQDRKTMPISSLSGWKDQ